MKKMLVGFLMDGKAGGVDKYLLTFLKSVSGEGVQIDFLTNEIDKELKEELSKYGSQLFGIANLKHPYTQYRQVKNILKNGSYDAVYLNISTAIDCIAAIAAKHAGVQRRMLHSHSSGNDCESAKKRIVYNAVHKICRTFFWRYGTEYYGCSKRAGEWLFPEKIVNSEKFKVIYNAVDRKRFEYSPDVRSKVRRALCVEQKIVVGHVGNFCYQKNHAFLMKVFAEVLKKNKNAILLLAGDGVRYERTKRQAEELGIKDAVLFLGRRTDVNELFQAMDIFVLPSNFEGLPIVGVEAQSSGLPCIMSAAITEEAKITENCMFLSLDKGEDVWAEQILKAAGDRKEASFLNNAKYYNLDCQREQLKQLVL